MPEKIKYGKKDIKEGDVFEVSEYLVHCTHASPQVLRFALFFNEKELHLQKILIPSMRQPWRVLKSNFQFTEKDCGKVLNHLFYHMDDYLKPKCRYDRSDKS